jgi:hypothetical protein
MGTTNLPPSFGQRILAAHYLCLLEPGTPLFNTSAPALRQQRLLAKMA